MVVIMYYKGSGEWELAKFSDEDEQYKATCYALFSASLYRTVNCDNVTQADFDAALEEASNEFESIEQVIEAMVYLLEERC